MMRTLIPAVLLAATALTAQNRVYISGMPTNLNADWSNVIVAPDASLPNAFLALMPLSEVTGFFGGFAVLDSDFYMDFMFGSGNWLRCTLTADAYAYISDDMCAHQPGSGYTTPQALLTTDYDYGFYTGVAGMPYQPFPNSTRFGSNLQSYINGAVPAFYQERWQLRTRGWSQTDLWNGCGPTINVTPNFGGFLLARFTFAFS